MKERKENEKTQNKPAQLIFLNSFPDKYMNKNVSYIFIDIRRQQMHEINSLSIAKISVTYFLPPFK